MWTSAIRIRLAEAPTRHLLAVSDTGPGIPPEQQEMIFEPLFTTKLQTGTDLGLAVVRKLTSLYGGVIALDSARGRGATFTISLPKSPAPIPPSAPPCSARSAPP